MRIVIDMQGAQTESRFRGIGRYTLSLVKAIVEINKKHEIILLLNGIFEQTIQHVRDEFATLLSPEKIKVWYGPSPVCYDNDENLDRRKISETLRESFILSLNPDVLHITSFWEGYGDDAVLSIGKHTSDILTSVTLLDLIPLLYPNDYLKENLKYADFYYEKLNQFKGADLFLSISEFSTAEALELLNISPEIVINMYGSVESNFKILDLSNYEINLIKQKFSIAKRIVLYTGGADRRKNLIRLITSYAQIPQKIRAECCLVLAGKMPDGNINELRDKASCVGLLSEELVFTGYVTDNELIVLYNICDVYIFPSWHEGFGLPVLEAMACGAPVISANTTSLPEVVGLTEALFDPFNEEEISNKLHRVLTDNKFRKKLIAHGRNQVKKFSWHDSANRAINAWELLLENKNKVDAKNNYSREKKYYDIAHFLTKNNNLMIDEVARYISLNEQSGLMRDLFIDLSEIITNDAGTGVQRVVKGYLTSFLANPIPGFRIVPVYANKESEGYKYAWKFISKYGLDIPILDSKYPFNAESHINYQRGDIFFALDMQHDVQIAQRKFYQLLMLNGVTVKFLVHDLLPIQLKNYFKDEKLKDLHVDLLKMIAQTDGAICVSRATMEVYQEWLINEQVKCSPYFELSWVHNGADIANSNPSIGIPASGSRVLDTISKSISFLSVSTLEPRKGCKQLLDAFELLWEQQIDVTLVLVGRQGWGVEDLIERIVNSLEYNKRLFWLEGISDEYLEKVYESCSVVISASINEGFGLSLIEAAHFSKPLIIRDIPVYKEIAGNNAYYFSGDLASSLACSITDWLDLFRSDKHPQIVGLKWQTWSESTNKILSELTGASYRRRQLLIDISELVNVDAKSGIQRVVRSVLNEWVNFPPSGYRVELVYATIDDGYRYARKFYNKLVNCIGDIEVVDDYIDIASGDVFFGLDMQPQVQTTKLTYYEYLNRCGVKVVFLLYDLLPIQMPRFFPEGNETGFKNWLDVICTFDQVVCISKTVSNDLNEWVKTNKPEKYKKLKINFSHIGYDMIASIPTKGIPKDGASLLNKLKVATTFLMVGTLEPRKGYSEVIAEFEIIWKDLSKNYLLVIVGKVGWDMSDFYQMVLNHSEFNKRLIVLTNVSDEYLSLIYENSDYLIAASYGEGFGLPLIEASRMGLKIIARDIPIFNEVVNDFALYFDTGTNRDLSTVILSSDFAEFERRPHTIVPSLTWKQSSLNLINIIL